MLKRSLISLLIPVLFLLPAPSAKAQSQDSGQIGPSGTEVYGAIAGAAAGLAVGGFLIYHYTHFGRSLRGCAVSSPGGLQIVNEGDQRSYDLTGETAMIKAGDRVRVKGKKIKGDPNHRQFAVTKLSKDYGACRVAPATRL